MSSTMDEEKMEQAFLGLMNDLMEMVKRLRDKRYDRRLILMRVKEGIHQLQGKYELIVEWEEKEKEQKNRLRRLYQ